MATHHAVPAIGEAIVDLLREAARGSEFAETRFVLFGSDDFERPMTNTVAVYLYRITTDPTRRQVPMPQSLGGAAAPQLALRLHYLIASWGRDAVTEQSLLSWIMLVLESTPVLSGTRLNQLAAGALHDAEAVEVIAEELSLADALALWEGLGSRYRLSLAYVARVALTDSPTGNEVTPRER